MARTKRNAKKAERTPLFDDLSPQTRQAIAAVVVAVIGAFFLFSLVGYAGVVGGYTRMGLQFLLGAGAWLAPVAAGALVYALLSPRDDSRVSRSKLVGIALLLVSLLGGLHLYEANYGGLVGQALAAPLTYLVGTVVTGVLIAGFVLIGTFLTLNTGFTFPRFPKRTVREENATDEYEDEEYEGAEEPEAEEEPEEEEAEDAEAETDKKKRRGLGSMASTVTDVLANKPGDVTIKNWSGPYVPPSLSLLTSQKTKHAPGDVKANSNIIKRTLRDFGINVEMDAVESGPTITRYALKPAQGVRISRIAALQQELQLALKASSIRIEAPIPGKSLVGIEVPNASRSTVGLSNMLSNPEYTDSPHPLLVGLGTDVTGHVHFANVARMPHALIAGTTGAGKSVTIHSLIVSLLFRNSPEQLRFFMVDPKRIELNHYNRIPHLLAPVITQPKKTLAALNWAVKEMERRYDILESEKVQNLALYHENIYKPAKSEWEARGEPEEERENLPEPLPYIVIIVDELNDLMQAYPRELEALIVRLAQMSRAVGIHLILATQRPSVNVITGTIKANVPTRIALNVASQVDSRTIIDQMGAEKLLGHGDMLYLSSDSPRLTRLQSAFISDEEIKRVVGYLKEQDALELDTIDLDAAGGSGSANSFMSSIEGGGDDPDDDLFEKAKVAIVEGKKASTSFLQRKLRIGYSRAARLMDVLEEQGVIGPADGAKPREILIGREDVAGGDGEHASAGEADDPDETDETEDADRDRTV